MTLDQRVDRLTVVYRRETPSAPSPFDATRLSSAEQIELEGVLRNVEPLPGKGWGAALESLSNEALDRAVDLTRKAEGLAPTAPFLYMKHRDPGIGPCLCAVCIARDA
jgi:hypothetical protein